VNDGANAVFTVTVGGVPTPTVAWEYRVPVSGASAATTGVAMPFLAAPSYGAWQPVTSGVSANGLTLTVNTAMSLNGAQYRAVATNTQGTAVSSVATLTVDSLRTANASASGDGNGLAATGGENNLMVFGAITAVLLAAGATLLTVVGVRRGRREQMTQES
jgi:alpha-L-fucosidase